MQPILLFYSVYQIYMPVSLVNLLTATWPVSLLVKGLPYTSKTVTVEVCRMYYAISGNKLGLKYVLHFLQG